MNRLKYYEHEVELAKKNEDGYGSACYDSALKAYKSLMGDRHSGFSFHFSAGILIRMLGDLPLTPLTNEETEWSKCDFPNRESECYQHNRCSSLFKDVYKDGTVKYIDNDRVVQVVHDEFDDTRTSSWSAPKWMDEWVDKFVPITFPYLGDDKFYFHVRQYNCLDDELGSYDLTEVIKIVHKHCEEVIDDIPMCKKWWVSNKNVTNSVASDMLDHLKDVRRWKKNKHFYAVEVPTENISEIKSKWEATAFTSSVWQEITEFGGYTEYFMDESTYCYFMSDKEIDEEKWKTFVQTIQKVVGGVMYSGNLL